MTLLNPWGLLGLLAIPVIIGLHFFRQQRRSRIIGGLHLWDFARLATPSGRRFERLRSSLPLIFQILAALLLTLLLAGFDVPLKKSARHYAIILDDSVSMQAEVLGSSSAERAADEIMKWATDADRFTLVLAGPRPAVVAGPAARREELAAALNDWQPASAIANFDQALNIASKFGSEQTRIILVTDDPASVENLYQGIITWGVGRAAPNSAITFADRFSPSETEERIMATIQRFGSDPHTATLAVLNGDQQLTSQEVDLPTSQPVSIQIDVPATDIPLTLRLTPDDALAADDTAILYPSRIKPVNIFLPEDLPRRDAFIKAIDAVPGTLYAPTLAEADLAFLMAQPARRVRRSFTFDNVSTETRRIALGRDLVVDDNSPLTHNLSLAGVTWPFEGSAQSDVRTALRADISYTSIPLLYTESATSTSRHYRANIALESTNIFRQTAFPILIMNIIEECRQALPGLVRTNLRAGESIPVSLEPDPGQAAEFSLWREGDALPVQTWSGVLPDVIDSLPVGTWHIRPGTDPAAQPIETFRVNLFSEGESNLESLAALQPDFRALTANELESPERNFIVYYLLLLLLVGAIILAWVYHDAGH